MTRSIQELFPAFDGLMEQNEDLTARIEKLEWRMTRAESGYHGHTFAREPLKKIPPFPMSLKEIGLLPPNERYTK